MRKRFPFHPFLFTLYPIFFLATNNMAYVLPEEIIQPSLAALLATIIIYILLRLLFKNLDRAALITSLLVIWFFSLDSFCSIIKDSLGHINIAAPSEQWLVPAYWILGIAMTATCLKIKDKLNTTTYFLNLVSFGLVTYNTSLLIVHEWQIRNYYNEVTTNDSKAFQDVHLQVQAGTPDIYYIFFDGMGATSTFKKFYDYDNSAFISNLEENGFYVAKQSRPNYEFTLLSMSSSLNMQYLNRLQDLLHQRPEYQVPARMVQYNRVTKLLKPLGYKFVNYASGFGATNYMNSANINIPSGWAVWFNMVLLETTMARTLPSEWFMDAMRVKRTTFFSEIDSIRNYPGPKFVFVHLLLPHPPYLFNEDGSAIKLQDSRWHIEEIWDKKLYIAQVKLAEQKIRQLVAALLIDKAHQPIIILQGDHGPACLMGTKDYLNERMHIFNAYYFPDHQTGDLYEKITPVNSFRVILDHFFQAKLPLLPDETYGSEFQHPFNFVNVTKKLSD